MKLIMMLLVSLTLFLSANIDEEIEAIKSASVEVRFKLMNKFKKNIIKMKEEERLKAMKKLLVTTNHKKENKELLNVLKDKAILMSRDNEIVTDDMKEGERDAN